MHIEDKIQVAEIAREIVREEIDKAIAAMKEAQPAPEGAKEAKPSKKEEGK